MESKFLQSIKLGFNKLSFWTKKNSPAILTVTGIVTSAVSIFLACKATTKINDIVKPSNEQLKVIRERIENEEGYSEEGKKELLKEYGKLAWNLTKLYGPSALTFGASIASFISSHNIMKGRNLALAASYTAIDTAYKAYRERVKDKFGVDVENELYHNIQKEIVKTTEVNKKGKEIEVEKTIDVAHSHDELKEWLFDEKHSAWTCEGCQNIRWLKYVEQAANQKLRTQGYLFLYDVYKMLDIEDSWLSSTQLQASRILGWLWNPNSEEEHGDNFVSFGISDYLGNMTSNAMQLVRNEENNIWLEFNYDGDILTGDGVNKKNLTNTVRRF